MTRKKIAPATADEVLYAAANTCCICRDPQTAGILQIHHVDGKPDNGVPDNLAPVCPNCHNGRIHATFSFLRGWSQGLVRRYRDEWYAFVDRERDAGRPVGQPTRPPSHLASRPVPLILAALAFAGAMALVSALTRPQGSALPPVTKIEASATAAPTNLRATAKDNQVILRWDPAQESTIEYLLVYKAETSDPKTVLIGRANTRYTVNGLDPTTPYCFRLWAVNVGPDGRATKAAADAGVRGCQLEPVRLNDPPDNASGPRCG